jgi:hypothetical protein
VRHPGPPRLPPDHAPGGLVFRCYATDGTLLLERKLINMADVARAPEDGLQVSALLEMFPDPEGVVVVVYDGDSGRRWSQSDWLGFINSKLQHYGVNPEDLRDW